MTTTISRPEIQGSQSLSNVQSAYRARKETILTKTETPTLEENQYYLRKATLDDVEAAFELFDTCARHMIGKPEVTLSHVRSEWTSPGFDLENSVRVVDGPDNMIIGYIEVWDVEDPPVSIWVWGRVHPVYEGLGIGTMLMDWAEERAQRAIARAPEGSRVVMRSGTFSGYEPAQELLTDLEMDLERHFLTMAIELPDELDTPLWPEGIELRSMKGEEEARSVIHAVRDAFKDHFGYVDTPFEQEYEQWLHYIRNDEKFDPSVWFLAMDGEEIAGMALCQKESDEDPEMGWVSVLGVLRPWRRQGLGLALLLHSFGVLKKHGSSSVGLGVDASSLTGAKGLYEKAGMHRIRQFDTYEKELRPGRDLAKRTL